MPIQAVKNKSVKLMRKDDRCSIITKLIIECKTMHHSINRRDNGRIGFTPDICSKMQSSRLIARHRRIKYFAPAVNCSVFVVTANSVAGVCRS